MIAFIAEWILLVIAVIAVIPAYYLFDTKGFIGSSFFSIISIGAAIWFFWPSISPLVDAYGIATTVTSVSIVYLIGAIVTAPIYFIVYCWGVKDRYVEILQRSRKSWIERINSIQPSTLDSVLKQNEAMREAFIKYRTVKDESSRIFDNCNGDLKIYVEPVHFENDEDKFISDCEASVNKVLPPKFSDIKPYIISAGVNWPITLIWILTSRILNQLIDRITSMFGGTFNVISKIAFGKF